jgi:AraC family transcriptional regulator of adaptative response / DNA-3-methyladenine glycosylase II
MLDRLACDRARRSRDARFDGRFFIGVISTRVYCRPICPARAPKDENVRYFPTAAAAEAAGFRPCLRCRPEASPGTPAWSGTSGVVSRALGLIGDGVLDESGVDGLSERVGLTSRHLRRLFAQHLGATPLEVALTRRAHFAKQLLDETRLSCGQIATAAGFGSVRRFNSEVRRTFHRTPTELRRLVRAPAAAEVGHFRFHLSYRPPYDWPAVFAFLSARATPGVECVQGDTYSRTITVNGRHGTISVAPATSGSALILDVQFGDARRLLSIVERVRRVFDLGADPILIGECLGTDRWLRRLLARHPGIRTPGAWDGFELAVRAVLGQQVTVRAATTMAGRLAERFGSPIAEASNVTRAFPTPEQLVAADIESIGVVRSRAHAIRSLAREVARGAIRFDTSVDRRETLTALTAIPGIGEWTAQYIAMRALTEPDAFPSGDLVLRRMVGNRSARELDRRSQAWRPWRAYAVMLLWQAAVDGTGTVPQPPKNAAVPAISNVEENATTTHRSRSGRTHHASIRHDDKPKGLSPHPGLSPLQLRRRTKHANVHQAGRARSTHWFAQ